MPGRISYFAERTGVPETWLSAEDVNTCKGGTKGIVCGWVACEVPLTNVSIICGDAR